MRLSSSNTTHFKPLPLPPLPRPGTTSQGTREPAREPAYQHKDVFVVSQHFSSLVEASLRYVLFIPPPKHFHCHCLFPQSSSCSVLVGNNSAACFSSPLGEMVHSKLASTTGPPTVPLEIPRLHLGIISPINNRTLQLQNKPINTAEGSPPRLQQHLAALLLHNCWGKCSRSSSSSSS
eukprot:Filipodium_phascolosomae@DN2750_c1_g1_i3.p1